MVYWVNSPNHTSFKIYILSACYKTWHKHVYINPYLCFLPGESCEPVRTRLLSHMTDMFESAISTSYWETVSGGSLGIGCGTLLPLAHGKNLYFNGCGIRQAITAEMDVTKVR